MANFGGPHRPDPAGSADEVGFVATLNQLRQMSGHTYRRLGQQTGIPPSTLHDTLTNRRRPRREVISAVSKVYASDDAEAQAWLATWSSFGNGADDGPGDGVGRGPGDGRGGGVEPGGRDGNGNGGGAARVTSIPLAWLAVLRGLAGGWRRGQIAVVAVLMAVSSGVGAVGTLLLHRRLTASVPVEVASRRAKLPVIATSTTQLTVYNAEVPCQQLRTVECGLGLFHDPMTSGERDSIVSRVYHGDRIEVICVVENGRRFVDEAGVSTYRWYKVIVPSTTEIAWLAAVRTRNTVEISRC